MSAYAFYNSGDFDNCIGAATRYVTLASRQPGCGLRAISDRGLALRSDSRHFRDQGRTEKAIAALEEVIRKYPTSEYAVSAKAKLEGARDQLAGKEMEIGRYNLEKRNYTGAITGSRPWSRSIRPRAMSRRRWRG